MLCSQKLENYDNITLGFVQLLCHSVRANNSTTTNQQQNQRERKKAVVRLLSFFFIFFVGFDYILISWRVNVCNVCRFCGWKWRRKDMMVCFWCVCDVVYHKNYFMCKEYLSSRNHKVDDIELKARMCMILMMLSLEATLFFLGWMVVCTYIYT